MKRIKIPENVKWFAYDGCHKIYLIEGDIPKSDLFDNGYAKGDVRPISKLQDTYNDSCPFRFVAFWDLSKDKLIKQGE